MIRVIIPAFNEAGPLPDLLTMMPTALGGLQVLPLVISDGSTDGTVDVPRDAGVEVIDLPDNHGKGYAVSAALQRIAGESHEFVVVMDGDGQHSPRDLARLLDPLLYGEADISVGSRYVNSQRQGTAPLNRYMVRWLTVHLLDQILGKRFSDPYCGYRAFSRTAIEAVEYSGDRYEGELEVLFDASRLELNVVEVEIEKIYRPGTSKMSADGGRLLGRLRVINQYTKTIVRKRRELRRSSLSLPALERVH